MGSTKRLPVPMGIISRLPRITLDPDWFHRLNCAEMIVSWSMRDSTCLGPKTSASVGKRKASSLP
ncbi:hypothetical protein D3C83_186550 [compost metagenome]